MSETRELIKTMDVAISVLEVEDKKIQQLREYVSEAEQIEAKKWKGILWGKKGIATFFALLILPLGITYDLIPPLRGVIGALFDNMFLFAIVVAVCIGGVFLIAKSRNAKHQAGIDEIEVKYNAVQAEIKEYEKQNADKLAILPQDYWDYNCANILRNYLSTGRADSMKEAINLFEEEAHRERLEAKQQEILEEQQRTSAYAAEAAKQAKWAAINSGIAAYEASRNGR